MENALTYLNSKSNIKTSIFDLIALLGIFLVPAISHLVSFPVYYLEPMRIMTILAIAHTSRINAYLIAFTLPVFSFLISAHPSLIKTSLITSEFLLNVWLFFFLSEKFTNKMFSMLISILLSKFFYYSIKFALLNNMIMSGNLISTPIYFQIIVLLILTGYIWFRNTGRKTI